MVNVILLPENVTSKIWQLDFPMRLSSSQYILLMPGTRVVCPVLTIWSDSEQPLNAVESRLSTFLRSMNPSLEFMNVPLSIFVTEVGHRGK